LKFVACRKPLDIVNIGEEIADTIWHRANEGGVACGQSDSRYFQTNWCSNSESGFKVTADTVDAL
jgi:hypothetical protein